MRSHIKYIWINIYNKYNILWYNIISSCGLKQCQKSSADTFIFLDTINSISFKWYVNLHISEVEKTITLKHLLPKTNNLTTDWFLILLPSIYNSNKLFKHNLSTQEYYLKLDEESSMCSIKVYI